MKPLTPKAVNHNHKGVCNSKCADEFAPQMHTPTPWNTDGENIFYCPPKNHESMDSDLHIAKVYVPTDSEGPEQEGLANAAFIVKAVNMHEELLSLLREIESGSKVGGLEYRIRQALASSSEVAG